MTPFLHFRVWWRRASRGSQATAVVAGAAILALLVWIAVPPGRPSSSTVAFGGGSAASSTYGTAPGARAGTGAGTGTQATPGVNAPSPSSGQNPSQSTGSVGGGDGATSATTPNPGAPITTGTTGPAATKACTGAPVKLSIGVVLINVSGLNAVFGVPPPNAQQAEFNAVFDSVNKSAAAGCTTLVGDFQTYNELDTSTAQTTCLAFAQHRDFAVLNGFLPLATDDCVLQHHIPLLEIQPIAGADVQSYYPYYFSAHEELQREYRNFAYATQRMGVWQSQSGFKKLGVFYRDCQPDVNTAFLADMAAVGVPSSKIVRFDVGCPADFAAGSTIEQAILQFKSEGVTTVTIDNDLGDVQNLTKVAQNQGFHPRWVIPDNGIVGATGSIQFSPDTTNFDGALAITPDQYGAANSGIAELPATKTCDQVMTSHGQPAVMQSPSAYAGVVCDVTWMLAAAIKNAPTLSATQLANGLQQAGSVTFSYPFGPNSFVTPGTTYGGQDWRPVTFHKSCSCWQVDNPGFQPPF